MTRGAAIVGFTVAVALTIGAGAAGRRWWASEPVAASTAVAPAAPVPPVAPAAARATSAPITESPRAVPTTPRYRAPRTASAVPPSADPGAIYRCRDGSGTRYSDEPCVGGKVVDGASAVGGYDTRPSDRLARLVADGRMADGPSRAAPARRDVPASVVERPDLCATLRRQVADLDAAALDPGSSRRLDELRAVRQDVRTTMAREHC